LAKALGTDVTGVCSTRNVELVECLGADQVVDYTKEDFTQSGQTYDLIFDAAGKSSFPKCRDSLNPAGAYVSTMLTAQILLYTLWTSVVGKKKALFATPKVTPQDLQFVNELVTAGKLRPVIDRTYPLGELAEAHRYAEQGHVRGRVVIAVRD
jgi:NADPH:quinone reductase-like Zn-dependent oxidoreductase